MSSIAEIRERLARIETKLDALIGHEKRLRTVENRQHYWAGAGTIVGAIVAWLAKGFVLS